MGRRLVPHPAKRFHISCDHRSHAPLDSDTLCERKGAWLNDCGEMITDDYAWTCFKKVLNRLVRLPILDCLLGSRPSRSATRIGSEQIVQR